MISADLQRQSRFARRDQATIQMIDRCCVVVLVGNVHAVEIVGERQPRLDLGKTRTGRCIPLHRRAGAVAPEALSRNIFFERILHAFGRDCDLLHSDLVAVVQRRGAAQRQQQHRGDAGLVDADAAGDPRLVMIAENPIGPAAARERRLVFVDEARDRSRVPRGRQQGEIEGKMRAENSRP